ncbi:hypothetical protein [Polycladidibacter hongkongensis]|nr:hypothetical protein [Pseudovibrio hongkongensis]
MLLPAPKLGEPYLRTPGPLTTSAMVKEAMLGIYQTMVGLAVYPL